MPSGAQDGAGTARQRAARELQRLHRHRRRAPRLGAGMLQQRGLVRRALSVLDGGVCRALRLALEEGEQRVVGHA